MPQSAQWQFVPSPPGCRRLSPQCPPPPQVTPLLPICVPAAVSSWVTPSYAYQTGPVRKEVAASYQSGSVWLAISTGDRRAGGRQQHTLCPRALPTLSVPTRPCSTPVSALICASHTESQNGWLGRDPTGHTTVESQPSWAGRDLKNHRTVG